jgi:hypothetical protein
VECLREMSCAKSYPPIGAASKYCRDSSLRMRTSRGVDSALSGWGLGLATARFSGLAYQLVRRCTLISIAERANSREDGNNASLSSRTCGYGWYVKTLRISVLLICGKIMVAGPHNLREKYRLIAAQVSFPLDALKSFWTDRLMSHRSCAVQER